MENNHRPRFRDLGFRVGKISPGETNSITDLSGVKVGHKTLIRGSDVRTGVTAVLPHGGNLYRDKVPAAVEVGNGFGKIAGVTQIQELGWLESPVVLTNTLSVGTAIQAVNRYTLRQPGNQDVRSVNAVVGETNDGYLNDIRRMSVTEKDVLSALDGAGTGPFQEGCVGAGSGTISLGFKAGVGTSSRVLKAAFDSWKVGVLVQANFGGRLLIKGLPVGEMLDSHSLPERADQGSCLVVVGTDAPLDANGLRRLAKRSLFGIVRTGSVMNHGSGDYALAFSSRPEHWVNDREPVQGRSLSPRVLNRLFEAVVEAAQEAVYNALFTAHTMNGVQGRKVEALPVEKTAQLLTKYRPH